MGTTEQGSSAGASHETSRPSPELIPNDLRELAAARIISPTNPDRNDAGRRLVQNAASFGIDLSLMWGTFARAKAGQPASVRQVCMVILGPGKTGNVFISEDDRGDGDEHEERVAVLRFACRAAFARLADRLRLLQALPDPRESSALRALRQGGFADAGTLCYLAGPIKPALRTVSFPPGWVAQPLGRVKADQRLRDRLCTLLEQTYVQTLDCPELCGLRSTRDVLESHLAAGQYRPGLWFVLTRDGVDQGCCLLNLSADSRGVELVYLGLVPGARGCGVAAPLLSSALHRAASQGAAEVFCAVDERNTPAIRLYDRFGLRQIGSRVALVLAAQGSSPP